MTDPRRQVVQNLTDDQKKTGLRNLLDNSPHEAETGVIKQLLGVKQKPLSPAQQKVFDQHIEPALTEKCGAPGCRKLVPAGVVYCDTCDVEYGGTK